MKQLRNRSGFTIVEVVIIIVIIAIIGLLGYVVYNNVTKNKTTASDTQTSSQSATTNGTDSAPTINSTADLDKATAALDQTDTGSSSDASQLDTELGTF